MKLLLHILAFLLLSLPTYATETIIDAAQNLAKRYCDSPTLKKTGVKASSLRSASQESISYFIFSDDASGKFCIVDGNADKVLGFGDNFSDNLPPVLQEALDMYSESPRQSELKSSELRSATVREDIPAFMGVVFGTRFPYNKFIPLREGSDVPVGCVPVTLAQICKYYEHPSKLLNDIPVYSHTSAVNPDTVYQIEGQKAEGRTYDWSLILDHYKKDSVYSDESNDEIAKLMWDCARSVETKFEQSGSSAKNDRFLYALSQYFGYNSDSIKYLSRDFYGREAWLDIIHEELSKKRPIYMSSSSYHGGGHAFICDGYVDGYLHINWGWNGSSDGYFDVDILDYKHNKDKEQTTPDNGYSFFETIIIGIVPGEGKASYESMMPRSVDFAGEYANGSITLTVQMQSERPEKSQEFFALAIVVDGDTLMSTDSTDVSNSQNPITYIRRDFANPDMDKKMSLIVMQADTFSFYKPLNVKEWTVCKAFKPITFTLSDCSIFSKELTVDTIIHTTKGTKHRFEITFSNPSQYEFYNDIYFVVEDYNTGLMLNIPANGTTQRIFEYNMPVLTKYKSSMFGIVNDNKIAGQLIFQKDSSSHVLYGMGVVDETTIGLDILNSTSKKYNNTFVLCYDSDSISGQNVTVKTDEIVRLNFTLPVIVSDTDFINLGYDKYSIYDQKNNLLGSATPLSYYGIISQSFDDKGEKIISVKLKPTNADNMTTLIIGVTSSLDDTDKYQKMKYKPTHNEKEISIEFKLSDYCSLNKPTYIGLCKTDGSFYAYMKLSWPETDASPTIPSNNLSIIAVDGGIWISSDVMIGSLPIYNISGKTMKTVALNPNSSLFVPLAKGIYVTGDKKVLVK